MLARLHVEQRPLLIRQRETESGIDGQARQSATVALCAPGFIGTLKRHEIEPSSFPVLSCKV
jgi:hypothetical protein